MKRTFYPFVFLLGLLLLPVSSWAQFDESYYDIAGIKGAFYLQSTEYKDALYSTEGMGYGAGLYYDRQISGRFAAGYQAEYFRRETILSYDEESPNQLNSEKDRTTIEEVFYASVLLKYFPVGDFWMGVGPLGYFYHKPEGIRSDAGIAFAIGYNWWLSWGNKTDFGQTFYKFFVLSPEIRIAYNLSHRNSTSQQLDIMFYLGFGTRAFRPEFY